MVFLSRLFCFPVVYGAALTREAGAYSIYRARVCLVCPGVAAFLYLCEGLVGGAVELKLEDVDVLRRLYDAVGASLRELLLRVDGVA